MQHNNVDLGSLDYFERSRRLKGDALLTSLIGETHKIGNPSGEEGDTWEDIPDVIIRDARVIGEGRDARILVDTEETSQPSGHEGRQKEQEHVKHGARKFAVLQPSPGWGA